jgi:hypothetical protein
VQNSSADNAILVVPNSLSNDPGALELAVILGAKANDATPSFQVVDAAQVSPAGLRGHTVLLDGIPDTNPLLNQIRAQIPLFSTAGFQTAAGTSSAVRLSAQERSGFGLVEEFVSPWDSSQLAVLVSGSSSTILDGARHALANDDLEGTVALVDAGGNARSVDTSVHEPLAPVQTVTSSRPIRELVIFGIAAALIQILIAAARGGTKKG